MRHLKERYYGIKVLLSNSYKGSIIAIKIGFFPPCGMITECFRLSANFILRSRRPVTLKMPLESRKDQIEESRFFDVTKVSFSFPILCQCFKNLCI